MYRRFYINNCHNGNTENEPWRKSINITKYYLLLLFEMHTIRNLMIVSKHISIQIYNKMKLTYV